jgi:hypothetical protein
MKNLINNFIFCLLIFFSIGLSAQGIDTTAFNANDREELLKEIEVVLTQFKREDCEKTLDDLKKSVKAAKFSDQHYNGFLTLTDVMVKRKMKRYNFIQPLLAIMLQFAENTNESSQYFDKWIEISVQILNDQEPRNTKLFEDYIKWSYEFWINGNLYKTSLGSHTWKSDNKDFDIRYSDKELKVKYNSSLLYCFNKGDSLTIKNANFTFYPTRESGGLFIVERATVEWDQEGATDAKCDLVQFRFNGRETAYKADSAILVYPSVFQTPLEGIFSDRITKRHEIKKIKDEGKGTESESYVSPANLSYPRFASISRNVKIENIGEGVDYTGGFRLEGSIVRGYGDEHGRSIITITNREGKICAMAEGSEFNIYKGERVVSNDAKVSLYFPGESGTDSIFHPNIRIVYNIQKREIDLNRGKSKASKVPFFNSLQQSEMNTGHIRWPIDSIYIHIGDSDTDLDLHSDLYFDIDKNEKYLSIITINPIIKFALYSEKLGETFKARQDGTCGSYSTSNEWEEPESIEELCERDPGQCPEWYLEEQERKKNNPDPVVDSTELTDVPAPDIVVEPLPIFDARRIGIDELLTVLDKRMEKLTIMNCREISEIQKKKNPAYKIIKSYKDWKDFERNFPKKYKFGCIEASDVLSFCNDVLGPQHNSSNGWTIIQDMIADGFVTFDFTDSVVVLREKLFHYKNSINKKSEYDYDNIKVKSAPQKSETGANAVLNIQEKSLTTNGVQSFVLSESRGVWAEPHAQKLSLKKNRDMDFDGTMYSGLLRFTGKKFQFQYDSFLVKMDTIDYINFFIFEREQYKAEDNKKFAGFYKANRLVDESGIPSEKKSIINNPIYNTSGKLNIDLPNNKSGKLKINPDVPFDLPSFESTDTGYVYYERLNRMNKYADMIYSRHTFFYKVSPFIIKAVDRFEPDALVFEGSFHSADIFPVVTEPLKVMYLDLSFGFEAETPEIGFPVYNKESADGKGKYTGLYGISNQGLIGRGRLDFLGAAIESEYIEFLPEQFITDRVDSFTIREQVIDGVEFPFVYGDSVYIDWIPYNDSMFIETDVNKNAPFKFFAERKHTLTGLLNLTRKGVMGHGTFDWDEGMMRSNPMGDLVFGKKKITSATSIIQIKKTGETEPAFRNESVEAVVDFENRKGEFKALDKSIMTDLPFNKYQTELDKFTWDMDKKTVLIESSTGNPGMFLALGDGQDSLSFEAVRAVYDLNIGSLNVNGVENIRVADAFIVPKGGLVDIQGAASMNSFEEARIIADTANQNHQIVKASIQVISKSEYKASGYLEFNVDGLKDQEILFKEIKVEDGITTGNGSVGGQDSFYLDKGSMFKGDIKMSAQSKNLNFEGYAKLNSEVIPNPKWFTIKSRIDKKNVLIDFKTPENPEGERLQVGLFLATDSLHLYPRILEPKSGNDKQIFTAEGVIKYDANADAYYFGDSAKVEKPAVPGNLLSIAESDAMVNIIGKFDFNRGFIKPKMPKIDIEAAGDISFDLDSIIEYKFNMAMLLNFPIPDVLTNLIVTDLTSNEESMEKINYEGTSNLKMKSRLENLFKDTADVEKAWAKVVEENRLLLPETVKHTFLLPVITLKWSEKTQSFVSTGKIGLSNLKGKHIGQMLAGGLEILPDPARGDVLTFYITSPNGDYYLYQYSNGVLTTISSNVIYMTTLTAMKKKDTKLKTENGESLEILPGNSGQYTIFKEKLDTAF